MVLLDGSSLTLDQLLSIADRFETVARPTPRAIACARRAPSSIRRARGDEPAYGINTGFGSFADVKIAPEALETLQLNLLRSHAAGLGDPSSCPRGPRDDGAAGQRAGEGVLRE